MLFSQVLHSFIAEMALLLLLERYNRLCFLVCIAGVAIRDDESTILYASEIRHIIPLLIFCRDMVGYLEHALFLYSRTAHEEVPLSSPAYR